MDGPRSHRDPAVVRRKLARLHEAHVRPLTAFVERLRTAHGGGEAVPWFDPDEAGVGARILLLLEAPGPRATGPGGPRPAVRGSGFISPDNDDPSAATMWRLLREAGIDRRREVVTWNVVPWYVGDGTAIRATRAADLDEARPALHELLQLLPDLRIAVLLGRKAAAGWRRADVTLPAVEAPHPSPQVTNIRPFALDQIRDALAAAHRYSQDRSATATGGFDLHATMGRLAARRPVFASESDFQDALAAQVEADHPGARVTRETNPLPARRWRLDLLVELPGRRIAIELKYPTQKLTATAGGRAFGLRDHDADDLGRYDGVKDVARLEEMVAEGAADVGYVLFLTNHPPYWEPVRSRDPADLAFRLTDGRLLAGAMRWGPTAGPVTRKDRDDFLLRRQYPLAWSDYSTVADGRGGVFRYLLIEVSGP